MFKAWFSVLDLQQCAVIQKWGKRRKNNIKKSINIEWFFIIIITEIWTISLDTPQQNTIIDTHTKTQHLQMHKIMIFTINLLQEANQFQTVLSLEAKTVGEAIWEKRKQGENNKVAESEKI